MPVPSDTGPDRADFPAVDRDAARDEVPPGAEADEVVEAIYDEADDTDTCTCDGMPGLCLGCESPEQPYAKLDRRHCLTDDEAGDEDDDDEDSDPRVLKLVNAYAGGMGEDPSFDLSRELPPDFDPHTIERLTFLTEVAQRRLDAERWDTDGSWNLVWFSCESAVTDPAREGEDFGPSGEGLDEETGVIHRQVSITNDDGAPTLRITGMRGGERHVMHHTPVFRPCEEIPDVSTLEGLRGCLRRATEQVAEAGYEMNGEWSVDWWRCHVRLADLDY
ncbi:hypothetical protein [Streptomyces sp. NBC_01428]|uniref:hypothetical protein n=1 Tax=Streptomyces sp. NBC_01428 TaxID=2903861 RepID=UPI002E34D4FD|nr:hypothetical protein [Streptomyces sp. NBC_01428]